MEPGTRQCHRCHKIKPLRAFYANGKDREHGRAWECKDCTKARSALRQRELREQLRPAHQQASRDHQRRFVARSLGLTWEDLQAMEQRQVGLCAICGRAEVATYRGRVRALAIDHDHHTGKVRELLCSNCNRGLGHFQEDSDVLLAAVAYLARHAAEVMSR